MGKNKYAKKAKKADAPDVVDSSEEEQNRRGRGDGRGHVDSSDEEAWQNAQRAIAQKRAESVKLEAHAPAEGEAEAVTAPPLTGGEGSAGGAAAGDAARDATVSADKGVLQQCNGVTGVAGSAEAGCALVDGAQGQAEAETASDLGGRRGERGRGGRRGSCSSKPWSLPRGQFAIDEAARRESTYAPPARRMQGAHTGAKCLALCQNASPRKRVK